MVEGCERQTYSGLATHLVKIAQKALKDCDMSALIESFEGFEQRRLKDLASAPSDAESDEEDAHNEEVVARVLFCLQAVVVNTAQCTLSSEQCSAFCKGSRCPLPSRVDVLTQVVELLVWRLVLALCAEAGTVLGQAPLAELIRRFHAALGVLLASLPEAVLGGCTLMMFGSIVVSGVQMIANCGYNTRNVTIASLALSIGIGFTQTPAIFKIFPDLIKNVFAENCVAVVFIVAMVLNIILPKEEEE